MKRLIVFFVTFFTIIVLAVDGCAPSCTPIATLEVPTPAPPTATVVTPIPAIAPSTPTPLPQGTTITVKWTSDWGPGTLRQALLDAQPYDTITFELHVFKPYNPATITVRKKITLFRPSCCCPSACNSF